MPDSLNFYLDDSGTRYPDRRPGKRAAHGYDWFALGGVLVADTDEESAESLHREFCKKWPQIKDPLHSVEIRGKTKNFQWLSKLPSAELQRFLEDLYGLMKEAPVSGIACVIDRPGYNARYTNRHAQRWLLCKTAFNIVVERAAKFALLHNRKLRIYPERCNKTEDALLKGYYTEMRTSGPPFDPAHSAKYQPLSQTSLKSLLYDFKTKHKSSAMIQLADLYLWPMCMGGYDKSNRPYARLLADGKLIEHRLDMADIALIGTKYSCFDDVKIKPW